MMAHIIAVAESFDGITTDCYYPAAIPKRKGAGESCTPWLMLRKSFELEPDRGRGQHKTVTELHLKVGTGAGPSFRGLPIQLVRSAT